MLRKVCFGLGMMLASVSALCVAAEPSRLGSGPATEQAAREANPREERPRDERQRDERPRVVSPYWDRAAEGDSPAADIRAIPPAKAAAVQARWVHNQLLTDLNIATRMLSMDLESKPEYRKTVAEENAAYDAMQSARGNALSGLRNNDAYVAGEQLRGQLSTQIRDLHEETKPDEYRIAAIARLKLAYVADNRKLEADALSRDSAYQDSRRNYLAAAQRVGELRQANALTVAMDTDLTQLRRSVAQSRIDKLVTSAYLSSSVRARNLAINYAAYDRSIDRYHTPYSGWYDLGGYYPSAGSRYGY